MALQERVSIWVAFATILMVALLRFLFKLYWARSTIAKLRKQGLVSVPSQRDGGDIPV